MSTKYSIEFRAFNSHRWLDWRQYKDLTADSRQELAEKLSTVAAIIPDGCRVMCNGERVGDVQKGASFGSEPLKDRTGIRYYDGDLWIADRSEARRCVRGEPK